MSPLRPPPLTRLLAQTPLLDRPGCACLNVSRLHVWCSPGSAMAHTDFQKMSLFQKLDSDGDTVISSAEWLATFGGTGDPVFLGWMRDVLCQLRDIDQGFRPVSRIAGSVA